MPRKKYKTPQDRLFIGIGATGMIYADRSIIKQGDYATVAHLSFDKLELKFEPICPADLIGLIRKDAAEIQSRKGETYEVTSSGQVVMLGYALE